MKYLLDTHLLIWALEDAPNLTSKMKKLINNPGNELYFSAASIWEIAIKQSRAKGDFGFDANSMRRTLLENGYVELPITGAHATGVAGLPKHHADPFDRLLISQATKEELLLVTHDSKIKMYADGYPVTFV